MTPSQLFEIWAPQDVVWSQWAKPVLFAEMGFIPMAQAPSTAPLTVPQIDRPAAILVDLPGREAVEAGIALAQSGYRPVPCFNGARGPVLDVANSAMVDAAPIITALAEGALTLASLRIGSDAPPAFLIDANRRKEERLAAPGQFDNRWVVFPQDFPSANFLKQNGIRSVLLLQREGAIQPRSDLAHVLLRWQQAGLPIHAWDPALPPNAGPVTIKRPSGFRTAWYRALTIMGLRRNSAGGFGSIVPEPSSGGHG